MLLIILATLFVLGIACFQAVQGIFSGLIMALLSVLSAAIAFNYYESLARLLYESQPAYADGIALIAMFVLPLLALRALADWAIRGNVVLGSDLLSVWVERVAAGLLGLITATVMVGVLLVAVQMLPFGPGVMGFEPFNGALERKESVSPFAPDEFALGMVEGLSAGALSGSREFTSVHDDLLVEHFCGRNTAGWHGRVEAPPGSIKIDKVEDFDIATFKPEPPAAYDESWKMGEDHPILVETRQPGTKLIRIELQVKPDARDEDGRWRLVGTHFRLVGQDGKSYYPLTGAIIGVLDRNGNMIKSWRAIGEVGIVLRYRDDLLRYLQPAKLLPGSRNKWDLARVALHAKFPPTVAMEVFEDGKSKIVRIEPQNLMVDWIYRIGDKEKLRHLVFRRTVTVDMPKR